MPARRDPYKDAYSTLDRAIGARGSERQALIEESIRLFHAARALEAKLAEQAATRTSRRRSFGPKPTTH